MMNQMTKMIIEAVHAASGSAHVLHWGACNFRTLRGGILGLRAAGV